MNKEKVLIVCYTFPPMAGIGGRRWAKFSKYLAQNNYEVRVVCSENNKKELSLWNSDVLENKNLKVYPHKFSFQQLLWHPKNIIEKILRKSLTLCLQYTKYSPIFYTCFPNKPLWNNVETIIEKEGINTVIVSGEPFLFYYASLLRKKKKFKLILDYRDLWNDHNDFSSVAALTPKQRKFFADAENIALNNCDKVVTVDNHLKNILSKRLTKPNNNLFSVIHNGFDEDDFKEINLNPQKDSNHIKLFFAGGISADKSTVLLHFIKSFSKFKEIAPQLFSKTEIHFYGEIEPTLLKNLLAFKLDNLFVENKLFPNKQYLQQLANADAGILLISKEYLNSFFTKFFDYAYLGKYIVAIGYEGELSQFLQTNNCGTIFTLQSNEQFFTQLHSSLSNFSKIPPQIADTFNIKHLTQQYIEVIEQ